MRVLRWLPSRLIASRVTVVLLLSIFGGPLTAQSTAVDGEALIHDLNVLSADSMAGRRVGTPGAAAARRHIAGQLARIGLEVVETEFTARDGVRGVNIEARIPGTDDSRGDIVLTAHYDHLGVRDGQVFNGADDNASGVAGVLAIARVLRRAPMRHGVTLVLFDGEEGGLRGAFAWVEARQEAGTLGDVALNVNLDMVSRSDEELYVAGTYQHPELRTVLEGVREADGVTLRFGHDTPEDTGANNWVSASDHGAFHAAGLPFLYFGVEDHPDYHRPTDTADKVDPTWYTASIETILRALRAIDMRALR